MSSAVTCSIFTSLDSPLLLVFRSSCACVSDSSSWATWPGKHRGRIGSVLGWQLTSWVSPVPWDILLSYQETRRYCINSFTIPVDFLRSVRRADSYSELSVKGWQYGFFSGGYGKVGMHSLLDRCQYNSSSSGQCRLTLYFCSAIVA